MIQIWMIDNDNFYTGTSKFVEAVEDNMTTVPLLVGYVKPKLVDGEWTEGATDEEVEEWKELNISSEKELTTEEKIQQLMSEVTQLDGIVAELMLLI